MQENDAGMKKCTVMGCLCCLFTFQDSPEPLELNVLIVTLGNRKLLHGKNSD